MYSINYDVFVNRNALFMYTDHLINNALHGGRSSAASSLVILMAFVCISYILLNLGKVKSLYSLEPESMNLKITFKRSI